ncbi:MAG: (Fe-S)-binding protein [Verrucomicrobiota bacterium]|nr:(Fe-S)-binding protein [Verrucomicrobiota bacterium]
MTGAILFLTLLGLALGVLIGIATKVFAVYIDPRVEETEDLLPGANCGGCGLAGCSEFAKALVAGKVEPTDCPVCSSDDINAIGKVLGIKALSEIKDVAVVMCCGDNENSPELSLYNGINDCASAVFAAGSVKACRYGCLGLGSCVHACPFNAIEITEAGIALVHPDLCVGCGKCVEACPRDLIKLVPETAECHILCSSPLKAPAQRKVCKTGCIGCRKCLKEAGKDSIEMDGFLAKIKYENAPKIELVNACPVKTIKPKLGLEEKLKKITEAKKVKEGK